MYLDFREPGGGRVGDLPVHGHVAQTDVALAGPDQGDGVGGLEAGLVEAREGLAGVGRLELGGGDGHDGAVLLGVDALVEAHDRAGQVAGEV